MDVDSGTKEQNGRTSISVPKSLHQELDEARAPGQSFRGFIEELLQEEKR